MEEFEELKERFFEKLENKPSFGRAEVRELFLTAFLDMVVNVKSTKS